MSRFSIVGPCWVLYADRLGIPVVVRLEDGETWTEGSLETFVRSFASYDELVGFCGLPR